jgi:uroporphyrinogen decarboxylase
MVEMTTHERMTRIYQHREPDRVPVTDWLWESTAARWRAEGLPADTHWEEHFGLDNFVMLGDDIDTSPRFEERVVEVTDSYTIVQDRWGMVRKNFRPISATFQHIDCKLKDPDSWETVKARMTPSPDRINWRKLEKNYKAWRDVGSWITVAPWFGYDVISTRMCDTETILIAMCDNPEWAADMFNHGCDLTLALLDMMWDKGYVFDELMWFDDMAYKNGMMFSKRMWNDLLRPYQTKVVTWAHSHGIKAHLHCCGNINALLPELMDLGVDMLNPLEVKAGMDPAGVKKAYGNSLVLRGGSDVRDWDDPARYEHAIKTILPQMMESGGYVFSSDHSIPDSVSLENYARIVRLVREIGQY